jgi:hypothetical protein
MGKKRGKDFRGGQQNARIFRRDGWKCVYCHYDGDDPKRFVVLVADHLDPQTKTNDDYDEEHDHTKVTACNCCNSLKGAYRSKCVTREEIIADVIEKIIRPGRERLAEWYRQAKHDTRDMRLLDCEEGQKVFDGGIPMPAYDVTVGDDGSWHSGVTLFSENPEASGEDLQTLFDFLVAKGKIKK